jgi:hypothetical protein
MKSCHFQEKWMELKIMLSEISQTKKDKHCMFSLICRVQTLNKLDAIVHTCNPSYLGGRDLEDLDCRPAWAKRSRDPNKMGVVACDCHPSYEGNLNRRIAVRAHLGKNSKT